MLRTAVFALGAARRLMACASVYSHFLGIGRPRIDGVDPGTASKPLAP